MVVVKLDDLVEAIVVVVVVVFVVFGFCTTLKGFSSVVVSQVVLNEVDTSNAIKIDLKKNNKGAQHRPFFSVLFRVCSYLFRVFKEVVWNCWCLSFVFGDLSHNGTTSILCSKESTDTTNRPSRVHARVTARAREDFDDDATFSTSRWYCFCVQP